MENRIFYNTIWNFTDELPETREELNQEVIAKQIRNFGNSDNWNPNEIIIDKPEIVISYRAKLFTKEGIFDNEKIFELEEITFPEEMEIEGMLLLATIHATLVADNKENFPALELLYKIHELMLNKDSIAQLYLEGLELNQNAENKNEYLLHLDLE